MIPAIGWSTFLIGLLVFGFAPGVVLRIVVLAFYPEDPRRNEILAELRAVPRLERPVWVAEMIEVALFEGLGSRINYFLDSHYSFARPQGVQRERWRPWHRIDEYDWPRDVRPGDVVKVVFVCWSRDRWAEGMWLSVTRVRGYRVHGLLRNDPAAIPGLNYGDRVSVWRWRLIRLVEHEQKDQRESP